MDMSDFGVLVASIGVILLVIFIFYLVINRIRCEFIRRDIIKMKAKQQAALESFTALVKSGKIDLATCRQTYNRDTGQFDIDIAMSVLMRIIDLWRCEQDVKILDNIALFTRGWVDYLAVDTRHKDFVSTLIIIIEVLVQEEILPENEYNHLAFNLRSQQKTA